MMGRMTKGQGLSAVAGLSLVALGGILIFRPHFALRIFPPLIGLALLIVGVQGLVQLVVFKNRTSVPGLKLAQSLVYMLLGLIFLNRGNLSFAILTLLFGVYVTLVAVLHLSLVVSAIKNKRPFVKELVESVFQLAIGIFLLFMPFPNEEPLWVRLMGLHFVFAGVNAVWDVLKLRMDIQPEAEAEEERLKEQSFDK